MRASMPSTRIVSVQNVFSAFIFCPGQTMVRGFRQIISTALVLPLEDLAQFEVKTPQKPVRTCFWRATTLDGRNSSTFNYFSNNY